MKEEIKKEILDLSPELIEIGNRNPFLVPDGYWERLEGNIYDATQLQNGKTSVPANYFENLANRVIAEAEVKPKTKIKTLSYLRWVAASVAVIFAVGYFTLGNDNMNSNAEEFVLENEVEEAIDYLEEQDGIYLTDVLSFLDEDIFYEMESNELYTDESFDSVLEELDDDQLEELF